MSKIIFETDEDRDFFFNKHIVEPEDLKNELEKKQKEIDELCDPEILGTSIERLLEEPSPLQKKINSEE